MSTVYPPMHSNEDLTTWLRENLIDEVECLVPDMNGVMRGKIVPREEFIASLENHGLRVPETVLIQSVTGESDYYSNIAAEIDSDILLVPDPNTIRRVPWYNEPVAQIICDCYTKEMQAVSFAPRNLLKSVLAAYEAMGLRPVIAPELEFYLVEKNIDANARLTAPAGVSGRREAGRQAYGIEAANEYDPVVNTIYDYCELCGINIGTMAHEAGPAQLEINFRHGDPLTLADQVFLFKRVVRKAAMKEGVYATFMAQPHESEPGSAMHVHQSVVRLDTGENIFATPEGADSPELMHYIAGLQNYVAAATPLFCPNVNSFRRMRLESDAPINLHWGQDNRTCGLRVPASDRQSRRIENRLGGADANPYIAFATTLACGLLGLREQRLPREEVRDDAHEREFELPRHLPEALNRLSQCQPLREVLGANFIDAFIEVKALELSKYNRVISSWEREFLLLSI